MLNEIGLNERQRRALGSTLTSRAQPNTTASVLSPFGPPRYSRVRAPVTTNVLSQHSLMSSAESPPIPLSIQAFQPEQRFAGQPRVSSWLFDVLLEIESLPKLAKKIGVDEPPPQSMSRITTVARLCDEFGLSEPIFDMRENGGVEIFCREGTKGLLVIIHQDWIQVFGDYSGEKWRARYDLSGSTWEFHLRRFIQDLAVQ